VRSSKALLDTGCKTIPWIDCIKNFIDLIIRFKSSEIMRHNISNVNVLIRFLCWRSWHSRHIMTGNRAIYF
jgi:hypothetical protein